MLQYVLGYIRPSVMLQYVLGYIRPSVMLQYVLGYIRPSVMLQYILGYIRPSVMLQYVLGYIRPLVNNSTNISRMNNHLSLHLKKDSDIWHMKSRKSVRTKSAKYVGVLFIMVLWKLIVNCWKCDHNLSLWNVWMNVTWYYNTKHTVSIIWCFDINVPDNMLTINYWRIVVYDCCLWYVN
jgi:hypothetical protein